MRVRELREAQGLSAVDLASKAIHGRGCLDPATIARMEAGQDVPTSALRAVAAALDVAIRDLWTADEHEIARLHRDRLAREEALARKLERLAENARGTQHEACSLLARDTEQQVRALRATVALYDEQYR